MNHYLIFICFLFGKITNFIDIVSLFTAVKVIFINKIIQVVYGGISEFRMNNQSLYLFILGRNSLPDKIFIFYLLPEVFLIN